MDLPRHVCIKAASPEVLIGMKFPSHVFFVGRYVRTFDPEGTFWSMMVFTVPMVPVCAQAGSISFILIAIYPLGVWFSIALALCSFVREAAEGSGLEGHPI